MLCRARTVVDKARVYEIRVRAYAMQSTFDAALQAGLAGLRLLDVEFPGIRLRWDSWNMTAVTQKYTACPSLAAAALEP